jgi:transcriptional regulator with XRE-family HTH domain
MSTAVFYRDNEGVMPNRPAIGHFNTLFGEPVDSDGTAQSIKNEFARRLEARRIELGWNQSELARQASEYLPKPAKGQKQGHSVGRDQISHYSRGISLPRPEVLRALAKALGCEPRDLVPAGVPSTVTPAAFRMVSIDGDRVQLTVNRVVSFETATKIVALLAEEDKRAST